MPLIVRGSGGRSLSAAILVRRVVEASLILVKLMI